MTLPNEFPVRSFRPDKGDVTLVISWGANGQPTNVSTTRALASSSFGVKAVVPVGTSSIDVYLGDGGLQTTAPTLGETRVPYVLDYFLVANVSGALGANRPLSNAFVCDTSRLTTAGSVRIIHCPSGSTAPLAVAQGYTTKFNLGFYLTDVRGSGRDGGI